MVVHTSKWSSGLDDNVTIQNVLPLNCEKSDIENWVRSNSDIWESIGRSVRPKIRAFVPRRKNRATQ